MIYLTQGQQNDVPAICSRNKDLPNPTYLWSTTHKLSNQRWQFIPYRIPPSVDYTPGYDLFNINVDDSIPQSLTGNTTSGTTNVHFIPGEYYVKVYEQTSTGNTNPNLSFNVVYETLMTVVGTNQNNPVTYSGTSDIYIMYNPDND